MSETSRTNLKPSPIIEGLKAYCPPASANPIDLKLSGNEGAAPPIELVDVLKDIGPDVMRKYPNNSVLEGALAKKLSLEADQVVVTAGADDALDRICRAFMTDKSEIIFPSPSFEMVPIYAKLVGAKLVDQPWPEGAYPVDEVLSKVNGSTAVICVVTPNNPTGAVASADDLKRLSEGAPNSLILVDLVYAECADEDLTQAALSLPNALVIRSFSKAWGLAGLRVGYVAGNAEYINWLRVAAGPFMVATPSLAIAAYWLEKGRDFVDNYVAQIRKERSSLFELLNDKGAQVRPSQANFVLARFDDATKVRDGLAELGIGVRLFENNAALEGCLRITCPGNDKDFARLEAALKEVL